VDPSILIGWLGHLAEVRLQARIQALEDRLRELVDERRAVIREPYPQYRGDPDAIPPPHREYTRRDVTCSSLWEQLLYEGVMEGLGYAKNRIPFRLLAQSVRLETLRKYNLDDAHTIMALLFGAAGLLPPTRSLALRESRQYVRSLRRRWKEIRPALKCALLHEGDWLFFRLRPANFPTARLAASVFLLPELFGEDGLRNLVAIFKNEGGRATDRIRALQALFRVRPDAYWSGHLHFRATSQARGIALGRARINELLINSVIPFTLLYARTFNAHAIKNRAREILAALPAGEWNSITRLMERDLSGGKGGLRSAVGQQGALQLYYGYCAQRLCADCDVGKLLFPRVST
jgi:hypothetical protein